VPTDGRRLAPSAISLVQERADLTEVAAGPILAYL